MFLRILFLWTIVSVAWCAPNESIKTIHIGYQKYGTLILVKARGNLEKRLATLGITVRWQAFAAGTEMVAAFKNGSLDFALVGETPPIMAQAAGAPCVYLAYEPASPKGEAILLPKNSPIQRVTELKGKKIAVYKNTIAHYLLVTALERENMSLADVQVISMTPVEGRTALQNGSVDAWVIWDPHLADAQHTLEARVLIDGSDLVKNYQFYIANRDYVDRNPKTIDILLEEVAKINFGIKQHPRAVAKFLGPHIGIAAEILETALFRMNVGMGPMNSEVIADQQQIADTFYRVGFISRPIKVSKAVWNRSNQ